MRLRLFRFYLLLGMLGPILSGNRICFSQAEIWIDVPYARAGNPECGPACALMLIQYWNQKGFDTGTADLANLRSHLRVDPRKGVKARELAAFFERPGFRSFQFRGTWDDLLHHLEKGRPLIVGLGKDAGPTVYHFVVVTGVDRNQRYVIVNDPAARKGMKSAWKEFDREWSRTGNWALLVLPKGLESGQR